MNQHQGLNSWGDEEDSFHTILLRMGEEYYGLPISIVREIIKPLPVTRFPKSPPFVEGVIDLRGNILPIVNLRKMFGLDPLPLTEESRFVDISLDNFKLGILVDAVSEVIRIPVRQVEAAPPLYAGIDGKYLKGIARMDDRLILLLNLDEIFAKWINKSA